MGEFIKTRLPDPIVYFDGEGVRLVGPGRWKTGPCAFHGGRDSLRVNTQSGGWCCMACGAKGGDVLAFHMQIHGVNFVEAARALGAYVEDDRKHRGTDKPALLSARDAMQLVANELLVLFVVIADLRAGVVPNDADWRRFVKAAGRVESLAREFA